ncbi:uncharacterized protein L969DRAFT_92667 [Mixia osmundae IAM 14324]|uniref:Threonine/serine exporter-like N-terminal domain-containing protein n=1 Tax=Mixia osmundae (strain CBS 9802 / IAM 14324 / JCM 22182 / KY 12970) TaxID=764103 RepID=G7DY76_MIXOS|nr:uncharacterized protein L969DRAFT_92667 [Mixia osmundae IAM 14324]KEI41439.1 hypothetical protein L969DRAFT_92667 [Mixia osmundae IAM 14324]GAA95536.1 hypothetical protein E5Q_02191 [Mixia osmundae IAM 14324]
MTDEQRSPRSRTITPTRYQQQERPLDFSPTYLNDTPSYFVEQARLTPQTPTTDDVSELVLEFAPSTAPSPDLSRSNGLFPERPSLEDRASYWSGWQHAAILRSARSTTDEVRDDPEGSDGVPESEVNTLTGKDVALHDIITGDVESGMATILHTRETFINNLLFCVFAKRMTEWMEGHPGEKDRSPPPPPEVPKPAQKTTLAQKLLAWLTRGAYQTIEAEEQAKSQEEQEEEQEEKHQDADGLALHSFDPLDTIHKGPFSREEAGHRELRYEKLENILRELDATEDETVRVVTSIELRCRQECLLLLARAAQAVGAPTYRLRGQLLRAALVMKLPCTILATIDELTIIFPSDGTDQHNLVKTLNQSSTPMIGKLFTLSGIHRELCLGRLHYEDATEQLKILLVRPAPYEFAYLPVLLGVLQSLIICMNAFSGSVIDAIIAGTLGGSFALLRKVHVKSLSSVSDILASFIASFVAAGVASTGFFCYSAVVSASIIGFLPGDSICKATMEIHTGNYTVGASRTVSTVLDALYIGFGMRAGASFWHIISGQSVHQATEATCRSSHGVDWWNSRVSARVWSWLLVPAYSIVGAIIRKAPVQGRDFPVVIGLAGLGWTVNRLFTLAFPLRKDVCSAAAAAVVIALANIAGNVFHRSATYAQTVIAISYLIPSGLGSGGLLTFASTEQAQSASSSAPTSHFSTDFLFAAEILQVSVGVSVGVFIGLSISRPFRKGFTGLSEVIEPEKCEVVRPLIGGPPHTEANRPIPAIGDCVRPSEGYFTSEIFLRSHCIVLWPEVVAIQFFHIKSQCPLKLRMLPTERALPEPSRGLTSNSKHAEAASVLAAQTGGSQCLSIGNGDKELYDGQDARNPLAACFAGAMIGNDVQGTRITC